MRNRVESGFYAINQLGASHYLRSMSELQKLDQVPFASLADQVKSGIEAPSPSHSGISSSSPPLSSAPGPVKMTLEAQTDPLLVRVAPNRFAQFFSLLVTGGILYMLYRSLKGGSGNEIMAMMKGTHQLADKVSLTFDDVIGLEEAKHEVRTLVEYLRNPSKYLDFGVKMPKGLLMFGPPGVGKTLLAKAMAGEAQVPFFYISGSQIEEVFVGLGASRIRELFKDARKAAPSIIFIDEVDAIGGKRDFGGGGMGAQSRQSLTQMLTLMDGFEPEAGVLVIAATNAEEKNLDQALLRSGRFDKKVFLHAPFREDRKRLFQYYMDKMPHDQSASFEALAEHMASLTWGCTGADVANIVNQAGILAVNRSSPIVALRDLQEAHADVSMGPENQSMKTTAEEKRMTAAHEAGHVIVALYCPKATPPRQVTIKPRKNALGYMTKDMQDHVSQSRGGYLAEIAVAMGGRAAEEMIYGSDAITSGAESDFAAATSIAEAMVTHFGFSDLGPTHFDMRKERVSEDTKSRVDSAVGSILNDGYKQASKILKDHAWEHERLTESLFVMETLTRDEIVRITKGERLHLNKA